MRPSSKPKIFYGYWIVLVAFLGLFIMSGAGWYAFSLFVKPLQEDMGWSRGEIMAGFTILFLIIGVISPFIGRVVDRYGTKRVIVVGAIITGLGFVFLGRINSLWHYYSSYAAIGVGMSAMGTVPATAVVSRWFRKKSGMAIGITSTAVGLGGFAFAPLVGSYLIPDFGWRTAYLALAILTWVLIIPLTLLLIKERPEDIGLYPDGADAPGPYDINRTSVSTSGGFTIKLALATLPFWLISIAYMLSSLSNVGAIQNQAPHLQDIGFPVGTAAVALGAVGLSSAIGKFGFGWLCDHIQARYACTISLVLQAIGVIILINVKSATPPAIIWLYAITMGLGSGGWLPTMSMLTSGTFGLASYGAIFGAVTLLQSIGIAVGPLMAGYMYDVTGTYRLAFTIFAALYAIAIPAGLLVRRPPLPYEK